MMMMIVRLLVYRVLRALVDPRATKATSDDVATKDKWSARSIILINEKHLKNVGPIRHCEPPHAACFTLPFTRCCYCRTPPAHRCPQQHRQQRQQRQRMTEGTAMAPWNGPNKLRARYCDLNVWPPTIDVSREKIRKFQLWLRMAAVSDACVGWSVVSVTVCMCVCVYVCVRAVENDLSYQHPNLVRMQCTAVARYALTLRSKGQRSRSCDYQIRCRRGYAGRYDCLCF